MDKASKLLTICSSCNGSGRIRGMNTKRCCSCGGAGSKYNGKQMVLCNTCHGSGQETFFENQQCGRCHGTGQVGY